MMMENDVYEIPEKYKKMSASEIAAEKQRLFQEIKSKPTEKRVKKTGCKKSIVFNFG
ncbi:MAG: hypothetical protein Q4E51_09665 [Lachnospiraceae bacterium]|nr:hypothetical protein [Candidatus Merdinaster equi]MDO4189473.1 hypothetical protein [Lachnospiraceae bacterium]MDO4966957.1 hypothetical protein [Lachnospiraceae bacterium]